MRGFTLIETIIYVGLFGILMVGVIVSVRPIITGAENLNERVMIENELALVTRTITSLIPQINPAQPVGPAEGTTADYVTFTTHSAGGPAITYRFTKEGDGIVGGVKVGAGVFATSTLTASRVRFDSMSVKRVAAGGDGTPAYLELTYVVEGETYGPIRSYLNF